MQKRVSTVIDGVPVIFELISVGPASPEAITNLEKNLSQEVSITPQVAPQVNPQMFIPTEEGNLQVVQVGNGDKPASPEEIEKVQRAINMGAINVQELMDKLNQIEQAMNSATPEKPWWTSRTILSNVIFILVTIAAVFGFQIQISEDVITLIFVLLSMANIWIRKTSKSRPISRQLIPRKK